jgi:uncharacterized damage-inducible protein DinB
MPTPDYVLTMARYNLWQNKNLTDVATTLNDSERQKDRGAFFGSIQKTFSHVYWADQIWLSRFADTPAPSGGIAASLDLITDWADFVVQRAAFDHRILAWSKAILADWFEGDITWYSGAVGKQLSKPKKTLVLQLFNHQTHHRGQIHAMLTAADVRPSDTDIPFMPEHYSKM